MEKKILAVQGSPRKGGKLDQMLAITTDAARRAGYEVDTVRLSEQNIGFCTGCMRCRESAACVLHDDLDGLREKLLACDVVILASPVYWANVPARVKNLFDRLSGTAMGENAMGMPQGRFRSTQKYLLLTACTTPPPFDRLAGQSSGALRAMREFFHTGGMQCMGKVVFAGTKGKQALPEAIVRRLERMWE